MAYSVNVGMLHGQNPNGVFMVWTKEIWQQSVTSPSHPFIILDTYKQTMKILFQRAMHNNLITYDLILENISCVIKFWPAYWLMI